MESEPPAKRRRCGPPRGLSDSLGSPDSQPIAGSCSEIGACSTGLETAASDMGPSKRLQLADGHNRLVEKIPITTMTTAPVIDDYTIFHIHIVENRVVQRISDNVCIGVLDDTAAQVLSKLDQEERVQVQLMANATSVQSPGRSKSSVVAFASAIIYGPEDLADDVGDFLDRCHYHLQDPYSCQLDVPYVNPHCLASLFEGPVMTSDIRQPKEMRASLSLSASLKALETGDDLPVAEQPFALKTQLTHHQKQALRFLLNREGSHSLRHIWQPERLENGSTHYVNNITGRAQDVLPPVWSGGILADEMGLGKTLAMISLVAAGKELQEKSSSRNVTAEASVQPLSDVQATLVVAPLHVVTVWEAQLESHVQGDKLSWGRYHGPNRIIFGSTQAYPDILFTTYDIVLSDWKNRKKSTGTLFDLSWRRVILDEAHNVRNKTPTSTAVASLQAVSRWAVTGTPIQNSLSDIAGLLRFLRFKPYDSAKTFDTDIVEIFAQHDIPEGTRRLKALCQPIMLRRSKEAIHLPPRRDIIRTVSFSKMEKEEYRRMDSKQKNKITLIDELRVFCNLGLTSQRSQQTDIPRYTDPAAVIAASDVAPRSYPCPLQAITSGLGRKAMEGRGTPGSVDHGLISSKARAVVEEVLASLPEKSVVFSFWLNSLRMVQQALEAAGVRCVRVDGEAPQATREQTLRQFHTEAAIQVILMTVSTGGVGLDLTAASRLHLMEPQWNPAVEDQIFARIHRMGQRNAVVITRYIVAGSIEEHVESVKLSKRRLADLVILNGSKRNGKPRVR